MYLWVAGAGLLRLFRFPWLTSLAIAATFVVVLLWPMMTGAFDTLNTALSLEGFFSALVQLPTCCGATLISTAPSDRFRGSLLPHPTHDTRDPIYLAFNRLLRVLVFPTPRPPAVPGKLDLSYGMYLWGWPIQQTLVHFGLREASVQAAGRYVLIIVLPIALASWLWIEKPALALKDFRWRRGSAPRSRAVRDSPGDRRRRARRSLRAQTRDDGGAAAVDVHPLLRAWEEYADLLEHANAADVGLLERRIALPQVCRRRRSAPAFSRTGRRRCSPMGFITRNALPRASDVGDAAR